MTFLDSLRKNEIADSGFTFMFLFSWVDTSKLFNSNMLNQKYWNVHKNVKPILSNLWRFQEPKIFYFQLTVLRV